MTTQAGSSDLGATEHLRETQTSRRVIYTGRVPFEILSMNVTADGWDVKFTKPVDTAKASEPDRWFLE